MLLCQADGSKSGQDWKGQCCLNRPGAVLVAIKAASIRKVPDPHMGSANTCPMRKVRFDAAAESLTAHMDSAHKAQAAVNNTDNTRGPKTDTS